MNVTHRCVPCRTFSAIAGRCGFCDEWMTPLEGVMAATADKVPAPDWPDSEPDQAFVRTVTQKPMRPRRTRTQA